MKITVILKLKLKICQNLYYIKSILEREALTESSILVYNRDDYHNLFIWLFSLLLLPIFILNSSIFSPNTDIVPAFECIMYLAYSFVYIHLIVGIVYNKLNNKHSIWKTLLSFIRVIELFISLGIIKKIIVLLILPIIIIPPILIKYYFYSVMGIVEPSLCQSICLSILIYYCMLYFFNLLNAYIYSAKLKVYGIKKTVDYSVFSQNMLSSMSLNKLLLLISTVSLFWYVKPFSIIFTHFDSMYKELSLKHSNYESYDFKYDNPKSESLSILKGINLESLYLYKPLKDTLIVFDSFNVADKSVKNIRSSLHKLFIDNFKKESSYKRVGIRPDLRSIIKFIDITPTKATKWGITTELAWKVHCWRTNTTYIADFSNPCATNRTLCISEGDSISSITDKTLCVSENGSTSSIYLLEDSNTFTSTDKTICLPENDNTFIVNTKGEVTSIENKLKTLNKSNYPDRLDHWLNSLPNTVLEKSIQGHIKEHQSIIVNMQSFDSFYVTAENVPRLLHIKNRLLWWEGHDIYNNPPHLVPLNPDELSTIELYVVTHPILSTMFTLGPEDANGWHRLMSSVNYTVGIFPEHFMGFMQEDLTTYFSMEAAQVSLAQAQAQAPAQAPAQAVVESSQSRKRTFSESTDPSQFKRGAPANRRLAPANRRLAPAPVPALANRRPDIPEIMSFATPSSVYRGTDIPEIIMSSATPPLSPSFQNMNEIVAESSRLAKGKGIDRNYLSPILDKGKGANRSSLTPRVDKGKGVDRSYLSPIIDKGVYISSLTPTVDEGENSEWSYLYPTPMPPRFPLSQIMEVAREEKNIVRCPLPPRDGSLYVKPKRLKAEDINPILEPIQGVDIKKYYKDIIEFLDKLLARYLEDKYPESEGKIRPSHVKLQWLVSTRNGCYPTVATAIKEVYDSRGEIPRGFDKLPDLCLARYTNLSTFAWVDDIKFILEDEIANS